MGNTLSGTAESGVLSKEIPPVEVPSFETSAEKRDRALKHLLKANHHNYSILYHRRIRHNHLSHSIASAYLLGASTEQLHAIYDKEIKILEVWEDSPSEVARHDWRDFLGDRKYQRAYLDFFEDELVRMNYDWKKVVLEYMLQGPEPLIHAGMCGLGHPLIHLAYAFELDSREIGMEALAMFTTNRNFLHKYIDQDFPTTEASPRPSGVQKYFSEKASTSPFEILSQLRKDPRFDGFFKTRGAANIGKLFAEREDVIVEYYHQLSIEDPVAMHRLLNRLATLLVCTTHTPGKPEYDFFIVHLLTYSYAVRVLLPLFPGNYVKSLLKSHWLIILVVYTIQLRPEIREELIECVDLKGRGWEDVVKKILGKKAEEWDAHCVKAVRTFKQSAGLWVEEGEFYLKAAAKFAWEFEGWTGYGPTDLD